MRRLLSVVVALTVASGCSPSTEPPTDGSPAETLTQTQPTHETFAGSWRSVTPSAEFVRLTVHSLSREQGVLGARLTFSGVAWEGSGRIEGNAFVANMAVLGATEATGVMRAQAPDARSLRVQMRNGSAPPLELAFVREH
jgi:hypothetical protein